MIFNPSTIRWTHSGQRVDGTPAGTLAYNAYIDGEYIASFPGSLNPSGQYELAFSDLGWQPTPGATHTLHLTAHEPATGQESAPSNSTEFSFVGEPEAPGNVELF